MGRKRRKFDKEFKIEAVGLACHGDCTFAQVERDLDIHPNTSSLWKTRYSTISEPPFTA